MTSIDLVGGVYTERCAFPYWDELLGSAGRAAVALTEKGVGLRLHTLLASKERKLADAIFIPRGIEVLAEGRDAPISFDYLHCLSVPKIAPRRCNGVFGGTIDGAVVIKFGMLETDPSVRADWCVYDPQSAFSPKFFSASGSTASHLAIITNKAEILKMTSLESVDQAVQQVFEVDKAEVVVVKDGLNGATVYASGMNNTVPAFKTSSVFTIGSGDVFVAAFTLAWAVRHFSPQEAATYASMATAEYVESRNLPIPSPEEIRNKHREPVKLAGGNIYLAGPFREVGQRALIDDALEHLSALKMKVFSPIHDIGPGEAEVVVEKDLDAIRQCDAVFAILNGSSPGTVFEVGFARALNKPVFCVAQNLRHGDLKLPRGSGAYVNDDYVTALFQIAWRST